jgi:hypothetical protein
MSDQIGLGSDQIWSIIDTPDFMVEDSLYVYCFQILDIFNAECMLLDHVNIC